MRTLSRRVGDRLSLYLRPAAWGPLMGGGGGGGGALSPVDLKKWQYPLSLFMKFPCQFLNVPCVLSVLRNGNVPCHYLSHIPVDFMVVQSHLSNLGKFHVALSNSRVKGPGLGHVLQHLLCATSKTMSKYCFLLFV